MTIDSTNLTNTPKGRHNITSKGQLELNWNTRLINANQHTHRQNTHKHQWDKNARKQYKHSLLRIGNETNKHLAWTNRIETVTFNILYINKKTFRSNYNRTIFSNRNRVIFMSILVPYTVTPKNTIPHWSCFTKNEKYIAHR